MSAFETALDALRAASIPFGLRRDRAEAEPLPPEGELDVSMSRTDAARADAPLRAVGFHAFDAPGHEGHRFWLAFDDGRWLKLDAKLANGPRRRTVAVRRTGPVVAILGPDGAGKGTTIDALAARIPVGVRTVYLGMDRRPEPGSERVESEDAEKRAPRHGPVRELLGLGYRVARAWSMLAPAYAAAWRGHVALCDRHPIEVLAIRPERTPAGAAFERFAARHLIPWPDAIVVLDAPGEALFARKGEHGVEVLERWRRGYATAFGDRATLVSTDGPEEESIRAASVAVWRALAVRRRW